MLPSDTRLISVDDHIIEPPDLWTSRLPDRYATVAPRVVELDNGRQAWAYEDEIVELTRPIVKLRDGFVGEPPFEQVRYDEMRKGCYDPVARLDDMDRDGVWGQLCFPNFPRFAGHRFLFGKDRELARLCIEAYNDFILDEWCATAPDRLIGLAVLPLWDVDLAAAEVRRAAERGAKTVGFSENPTVLGLPSIHTRHWDPLWAAVTDVELPVCMHIGSSSKMTTGSDDSPIAVARTLSGVNSMVACADWLFSGTFDRFPTIKIALSEGGIGWVPYILERANKVWTERGARTGASMDPVELFRRHVYVCMVADAFGLRVIEEIGVDNVMWESDFPHDEGAWPNDRALLEAAMRDIPDDIAVKVAEGNARRVFNLR